MKIKTFLLSFLLLPALAGVMAAGLVGHWWRKAGAANVSGRELPAVAAEYDRIMQRFRKADTAIDIGGTIQIYDGGNDGALKEENGFDAVRYGTEYYSQLSYMRTYCDGNLILTVDTVHRRLQVSRAPRTTRALGGQGGAESPGEPGGTSFLFSDTAQFKLSGTVEQRGAERVLTVHSDFAPAIRVCRIYYDTASYRLERSEIEWWKDRSGRDTAAKKIWLAKVEYVYRPREARDIGKEIQSYIVTGKDSVTATKQYAGYTVAVNF
jgi:hypothetical protein